jgi:hypothetical protein
MQTNQVGLLAAMRDDALLHDGASFVFYAVSHVLPFHDDEQPLCVLSYDAPQDVEAVLMLSLQTRIETHLTATKIKYFYKN